MRIHALEYRNQERGWSLLRTTFSDLTLLVGISGVGKTQILKSIMSLKRIAHGANIKGVGWDIEFAATDTDMYRWCGEFDTTEEDSLTAAVPTDPEQEDTHKVPILSEELQLNGDTIVRRKAHDIELRGEKTPRLSPFESVLSILSQEQGVTQAHNAFGNIIHSDRSSTPSFSFRLGHFDKAVARYDTLKKIQESELDAFSRLALAYLNLPQIFDMIKSRFISIFPQVVDVKLEPTEIPEMPFITKYPVLQILEKGVEKWISQQNVSSGMFRTIIQLSELYLSPDGTVVLIDEFENSLGVNCLDVLTDDLLDHNRRLQFIITSHHPYIINNVSSERWKIVTRSGGTVRTRNADDLRISRSSHESFLQLLNNEQFTQGIAI